MSVLEIRNLSISYETRSGAHLAVDDVSLTVNRGEVVAIVGETGSGKTTTAHSVIGLLPPNATWLGGEILLNGTTISGWNQSRLRTVRGKQIGLIPQDPSSSLDPVRSIGWQLSEVFRLHGHKDKANIKQRSIDLLNRVGLTDVERIWRSYPHELSGGMRQRVLIASAIALGPSLIIADESTSALDVTVQRSVLDLLDELRAQDDSGVLFVTHDLGVAAERADQIVVLQNGRVQDAGRTEDVLGDPRSDYTKRLLRNAPSLNPIVFRPAPVLDDSATDAIVVENLVKEFSVRGGGSTLRAVNDVSFRVPRGTTHALVGESGSGKSTTARVVLGFEKADAGSVLVDGVDVSALSGAALRNFRRRIQLVYQNPFASLDPSRTIIESISDPLRNFRFGTRAQIRERAVELLDKVALGEQFLDRKPRELSGGQRQRVAIARALAPEPDIVVLDEAISALDVSVQAQILELLADLQTELGLTYLFISHDLDVVRQVSDTVTVLSRGAAEESGTTRQIFERPTRDYTRTLLDAIPRPPAHLTRR